MNHLLLLLLLLFFFPPTLQQPTSDFLSLSCGASRSFTDNATGILWQPDSEVYVSTTASQAGSTPQGNSLRFFPLSNLSRNLNCYNIPRKPGLHLLRATFDYSNYDGLSRPPTFQLVINQTVVVNLVDLSSSREEFVFSGGGTTSFCLLGGRDTGAPFISSLEARPLPPGSYHTPGLENTTVVLRRLYRINCGELSQTLRYPGDPQDRIWTPDTSFFPPSSTVTSYNGSINSTTATTAPLVILQTSRSAPGGTLSYVFSLPDVKQEESTESYVVALSFAMLTNTTVGTVSFDILLNGRVERRGFVLPGSFVATSEVFTASVGSSSLLNITLTSPDSSSSVPEVNAVEVYKVVKLAPPTTNTDADALNSIGVTYGFQFWDHDPCFPVAWNEIRCDRGLLQVTSLDLSNRGLKGILLPSLGDLSELVTLNVSKNQFSGPIPEEIWGLSELQSLDLSFNELTGTLPTGFRSMNKLTLLNVQNNSLSGTLDGLAKLPSLESVNVMNNNFSGEIPSALVGKIISSGNICLGVSSSDCFQAVPPAPSPAGDVPVVITRTGKSSSSTGKVVGITVGASGALAILVLGFVLFSLRRRRVTRGTTLTTRIVTDARDWNNCKEFSYRELKTATNGFKSEIGKGGFGTVYHGRLPNGQEVAIKVRSDQSQLGAEAFINEVSLLSRIKHQNLVDLVGFCQKPKKQILVYEYMAGGTLMDHLYGSKSPLDWKSRVNIAVGAATGLNYLHNGCDPKIIHRDVKSTNILLDASFTAKVADFGLSKHLSRMEASHVTTMVKGTAGYLDPEYYASNQLTEKSDVYSLGVVLLEMICGREALSERVGADEYSIITWARPYLQTGAYDEVVDRNILGRYSLGSMVIVAHVACKSVSRSPEERPRMNEVARDLREALALS